MKVNNPKVTVIIPAYNAENVISDTLDSVARQSLSEIEVICVDDESKDGTCEVVKNYAKYDNRISLIKQKNSGPGAARNNALRIAQGQFVAFMDADDYYPDKFVLETSYYNAIFHDVKICGGCMNVLVNDKLIETFGGRNNKYTFEEEGKVAYKDYQFDYGYTRFIYDRQFLINNNLEFPMYKRFQDPPFFVKAMITAGEFYAYTRPVYVYRTDGTVRSCNQEKIIGILSGILDNLKMARENGLNELFDLTIYRLVVGCKDRILQSLDRGEDATRKKLETIMDYVTDNKEDCSKYLEPLSNLVLYKKGV